jgi:hypothetical protein
MLNEMFTRSEPYRGEAWNEASIIGGHRPVVNLEFYKENNLESLLQLIELCWSNNTEARPEAGVLVSKLQDLKNAYQDGTVVQPSQVELTIDLNNNSDKGKRIYHKVDNMDKIQILQPSQVLHS